MQKIYRFRMTYYPEIPVTMNSTVPFIFAPRMREFLKSTFKKCILQSPKIHLLTHIMKTSRAISTLSTNLNNFKS